MGQFLNHLLVLQPIRRLVTQSCSTSWTYNTSPLSYPGYTHPNPSLKISCLYTHTHSWIGSKDHVSKCYSVLGLVIGWLLSNPQPHPLIILYPCLQRGWLSKIRTRHTCTGIPSGFFCCFLFLCVHHGYRNT